MARLGAKVVARYHYIGCTGFNVPECGEGKPMMD